VDRHFAKPRTTIFKSGVNGKAATGRETGYGGFIA
jgi:hypothetical protein